MAALRVALFNTNYELWEQNGKWGGFAYALADLMLKISGVPFVYIRGESFINGSTNYWNDCVNLIVKDKVDFCVLKHSMTSERSGKVDYITPYVWEAQQSSFIYKSPSEKEEKLDFFKVLYVFDFRIWVSILVCLFVLPFLAFVAIVVLDGWTGAGGRGLNFGEDFYRLLVAQDVGKIGGNVSKSVRILFGVWIFAGIMLNLSFSGSIMSVTSLTYGFREPFSDMKSLYQSGYSFALTEGLLNDIARNLVETLNRNESPDRFYTSAITQPEVVVWDKYREWDEWNYYTANIQLTPWTKCDRHPIHIRVRLTSNSTRMWPVDFFRPQASFTISKRLLSVKYKLDLAAKILQQSGLDYAIFMRMQNATQFLSHSIEKYCKKMSHTRIRVRNYGEHGSKITESLSVFGLWLIGLSISGVIVLIEVCCARTVRDYSEERQLLVEREKQRMLGAFRQYLDRFDELEQFASKSLVVEGFRNSLEVCK